MKRVLIAAALVGSNSARGEPDWSDDTTTQQQPVLPAEDTRSEGPVARHWVSLTETFQHVFAPAARDDLDLFTVQLALGPMPVDGDFGFIFGTAFGWLADYTLRARWTAIGSQGGASASGPLTIALQRFVVARPLAIAPLVHLHAGIESALATPWLGDRAAEPPLGLQRLHAVDRELAANGFSIRPFAAYVRADLLVCRAWYVEAGIDPELFVPRTNATEYAVRWHAAIGASVSCSNDPQGWSRPLVVLYEARGRGRVDEPADHHSLHALALQYSLTGGVVFQVFGAHALGDSADGFNELGLRMQVGLGRRDR